MKMAMSRIPASNVAPPVYKPKPGVKAYVRLRPTEEDPVEAELVEFSPIRQGVITLKDPLSSGRSEHSYEFSGVFDGKVEQNGIFQEFAANIVDGAAVGCSGCIIAYGQTGSGKTYSIFGGDEGPESRGLVARAMERLFIKAPSKIFEVTFLEVYLEQIYDLAAGGGDERKALDLNEAEGAPQIQELSRTRVSNPSQVMRLLSEGLALRMAAPTAANAAGSSRSHTIFTVDVLAPPGQEGQGNCSLSFVDLAGSERLAKSKAEGARFKEAVAINSSLTALGKVVLTLAGGTNPQHIPIRDSKLTRILAPALLGNSQVAVLATLHPKLEHYEECLNTLSFADRCKNLAPNPRVHFLDGGQSNRKIRMLQSQVKSLEQMVKMQKSLMQTRAAEAAKHVDDAIVRALREGLEGPGQSPNPTAGPGAAGNSNNNNNSNNLHNLQTSNGSSSPAVALSPDQQLDAYMASASVATMQPGASSSSAGPDYEDQDGESAARTASASGAYASEGGSSAQGPPGGSPQLSPEPSKELPSPSGHGGRTAAEHRAAGRDRDSGPSTSVVTSRRDALTARAIKDPILKALQEVQHQRDIEAAKQANLLRRIQRFQEEQRQIKEMDQLRLTELDQVDRKQIFLDDRLKELKAQIQAMQEQAEHQVRQHGLEVEATRDRKLQHLAAAKPKIFRNLQKRLDFIHQHRMDVQERRLELEEEFKKLSQEKQDERNRRLAALRADWANKLTGLRKAQNAADEEYRSTKRALDSKAREAGGELIQLFQMVQLLAALICDAEEGGFTTLWRDGMKQVVIPPDCVPPLPNADSLPILTEAKAQAQSIMAAFEKISSRTSSRPGSARGGAFASRTRRKIAEAAAAGLSNANDSAAKSLSADQALRLLCPAAAPAAIAGKEQEEGGEGSGANSKANSNSDNNSNNDNNNNSNNNNSDDNNNNHSNDSPPLAPCTTAAEVARLLESMDSDQDLQTICLTLRSKIVEKFCPKTEKERMRMEAQMELEREATLNYIAQLEARRNELRTAVADEAVKQRKCQATLASTRALNHLSRVSTPASSSRGSRPSTAKSRIQTRPASANRALGGTRSWNRTTPLEASPAPVLMR